MELLKLSKFKLRLQALTNEIRDLREREHSATQQCHALLQKQRQSEEEHATKLQELQSELASSNELIRKLEWKVSYLENENVLFENRQKQLKEAIQCLLQSRETFVSVYEENTCEMRRSIEARDKKIQSLLDKINSHLSLFDSIEKEALSVKNMVDYVQLVVNEKEEVVASLRSKMDKVSTFEIIFFEKICDMENKIKRDEDELKRKDRIISMLEAQLEAAKVANSCQTQILELQKILSAKDLVIKNLVSEKEALHCEVGCLSRILQKIQETISSMNEEDKKVFSSALNPQEDHDMAAVNEDSRIEMHPISTTSMGMADDPASLLCYEQNSVYKSQKENSNFNSCASELTRYPHQPPCLELQSKSNGPSVSINSTKVECTVVDHQLDSECSTTQNEIS